jgi:hypothetical protein
MPLLASQGWSTEKDGGVAFIRPFVCVLGERGGACMLAKEWLVGKELNMA